MRGGARDGAGRKKLDKPKSERVMVNIDSETREKLEKAAADVGKSVSAFLNDLIQKNV